MELTANQVVALILAARTLSLEEKGAFLDLFQDASVTPEQLTEKLRDLAHQEVAYLHQENEELSQLAAENQKILREEEAKVKPQTAQVYADLDSAASELTTKWKETAGQQSHALDQVLETIQRDEQESDQIASLYAHLATGRK